MGKSKLSDQTVAPSKKAKSSKSDGDHKRSTSAKSSSKKSSSNSSKKSSSKEVVPDKPKKVKKIKDPNAPPKPLSGYFQFCSERRGEIREMYPDYKMSAVMTEMGALWTSLSDTEKNEYKISAKKLLSQWKVDIAAYEAGLKDADTPMDTTCDDDDQGEEEEEEEEEEEGEDKEETVMVEE